ncbi:VCBS domain-containing protein, partial [Vibrio sp. OPT18]|uniref:VCBS domain-containing protein n=1 Tax=Vibrio sp. OPT18 TaxID=2778641 RepID=UPI00187E3A64
DGTPSTIKVTINGTNDKATVSSATVAIDETDKAVTTSGTLTSTDLDNPDNAFTPDSIVGSNGNLTIDANGHWVFNANSAFNQLNVGDKVEEAFTVSSVDGTPFTIKVTINGTNDKAIVSSATVAIDETDKAVTTSGTLTSIDVDNPDNAFTPDSISGTNGDLTIDANGHWVFTANSAFNQLNVGDKVEETFTVSSIDGTLSIIKVTINGTNDSATVNSAIVAIDETDKAVTTSGTLTSTDVDNTDNTFTPDSITGTNGDLTIDANGHWVFTANSAFNQLNVGDKVEETFTVSSVDGTPSTIKVTINGTNDAATVSTATVNVDETDSAITTSGTLTSTDVDNPDNTFTPGSIPGNNGSLTIDANGHWVFTANSAFNQLNVGDKVEETFTVSSIDGTSSTIKVTINGTNDAATVSSATVAIDETDKAVTTSGTLTSTDVDNPDNTFTPDSITGTHGDLTIDANGHWSFTANSTFNQLNVGDKVEETFTVSSVDGTTSTIKVTINGTNDAATVSSATVAIDETDKAVTTSGTLTSTDVDNPDNTFMPDSITGTHGDLTIDANGHWTFTANSAFNQLNVGDKVEEAFTVSSVDGTPSTIKVTINGTNDSATVSSATVAIDETDTAISTSGTLTSTDIDNPDNAFTPDAISGTNGDLIIDANGHWAFTANSVFNQLNVGDKVEETFTVSSVDGTPSTIKVTINGTNDQPSISGTTSGAVVEAGENGPGTDSATGTLTTTDPDTGDTLTWAVPQGQGAYGTMTIDQQGQWHYQLDNNNPATNALTAGQQARETFTITATDSGGHPVQQIVTVGVTGSNDLPVISTSGVATIVEAGSKAAGISIGTSTSYVIDPDNGDTVTWAVSQGQGQGHYGTMVITQTGQWQYQLDNSRAATNALCEGDHVHETFTITATDSSGTPVQQLITVNITGSNDAAIISGTSSGAVTEESKLQTSGTLTVTDVDTGEAHFSNTDIKGSLGTLHLTDSGAWTYDLDNSNSAVQALAKGQQVKDIITVQSADGTPHQISIVVNGQNDAAVITGTTTGAVTEDRINGMNWLLAGGTMHVSDNDSGEAKFDPVLHAHNYAGIGYTSTLGAEVVVTPNGDWDYQLDNNITQVQSLGQGQSYIDKVTVHTVDGTTQELQITITGTNDAPTVTGSRVLPVGTEDQTLRITQTQLLAGVTDIDKNDASTLHVDAVTADHGSVTQNADGSFTFHPDQDYNGKVQFTYDVKDAHGGTTHTEATTTLASVGDSAQIDYASTDKHQSAVIEDASYIDTHDNLHFNGKLTITDPDAGEAEFDINLGSQTPQGSGYPTKFGGHVLLMQDGRYTYTIQDHQPLVQNLKAGEVITDECVVRSKDGTTFTIQVNIHGTNDAPTLTAQQHAVKEDGALLSGQMQGNDVDHGAVLEYTTATPIDGLVLNKDGSYTFDPTDPAYQNLANGQTQTLTIPVKVTDENNASSTANLTIEITGTNDIPVMSATTVHTQENARVVNGAMNATDADTNEILTYTTTANVDGFHLNNDGSYSFDPNHASYEHLGEGEHQ